jgi:hypothetical protein
MFAGPSLCFVLRCVVAYLLNHSKTYTLAFLISLLEFWIGSMIYTKWNWRFILLGLIFVIGGQV